MTTNQQTKTFTVPVGTRVSQGVELEFLVAIIDEFAQDPDEPNSSTLPPILRYRNDSHLQYVDFIAEHIRGTLRDHGIHVQEPINWDEVPLDTGDLSMPFRLIGTDEWDVGDDITIGSSRGEHRLSKGKPGKYRWIGIELRSPACWASPRANEEIRFVINLLKSKYRLRVNRTCGFHVHIGNGAQDFDARTLKRAAAFFFAADPLLSRLHAPWRRIGEYSSSIRYRSRLACGDGMTPADAHKIVRDYVKEIREKRTDLADPETLPVNPWSQVYVEKKDIGGEKAWKLYADARAKYGPFITLSESLPPTFFGEESGNTLPARSNKESGSHPARSGEGSKSTQPTPEEGAGTSTARPPSQSGDEGGAYHRRFREFMKTEAFLARCSTQFGHKFPDLLTLDEQYSILFVVICEGMFSHADLDRLSDSELASVAAACAPFTEITRSSWAWDTAQDKYAYSAGQVDAELQHPTPLAFSKLNASAVVAALAGQDERGNEDSSAKSMSTLLANGPPSPDIPSEFMLPSPPNDSDRGFDSAALRALLAKYYTKRDDDAPESSLPPQSNSLSTSPSYRKGPKMLPHHISQFPDPYMRSINREHELGRHHWRRLSWLPSPCMHKLPEPAREHSGGDACLPDYCWGHAVTGPRHAIATILGVYSGSAVGALMVSHREKHSPGFQNYDFKGYSPDAFGLNPRWKRIKRTIEFREAVGTLDADWAVTWTRICAGILRFCRDATPLQFMRVLERAVTEEERWRHAPWALEGGGLPVMYDACDLLDDICLESEAAFIRRREARSGPPR
ncbi:hypothetical protein F4861DRAFT_38754 [Xylaria intraflava]|nr:hypothetical protein F4861DRAFT_38754 [Xylaria intraflava]